MYYLYFSTEQVYSWGWGSYGQLGLGSENNAPIPTRIEELQAVEIKQIAARSLASAALTQDGKVYTWGRAKVNQFLLLILTINVGRSLRTC